MRGSLILLFALVFLFSCKREKNFDDVLVIGHAASGLEMVNSVYHDNSKEGMEFSLSIEGCNGVELDVQLSADGKLWFYHDTALQSETDGVGCIPDILSSELAELRYSTIHHEKLFSIEELDTTLFSGKHIFLDLRHYDHCSSSFVSLEQIIGQLEQNGMKDPKSFSVHCITGYKNWIDPLTAAGFRVCFSVYNMDQVTDANLQYPELEGYIVKNKDFTSGEVANIQQTSKKVYIFDVRSPKGIRRAFKKHPDGILTDDIRTTLIEKY